MRRLAAAVVLCWLACCAPAYAAGVNIFIGSSTIPALTVNQNVMALPADATGDTPGPVVSGGSAGTANLWIDTNGGTCTRQATAQTYSDAAACGTISAAYQAARNSDTVRVKAGTYSTEGYPCECFARNTNLTGSDSVTPLSTDVTIQAAAGETVDISLVLPPNGGAYHMVLDGFTESYINVRGGNTNVHLRNFNFQDDDPLYVLDGSGYVSLQNVEMGPRNYECGDSDTAKLMEIWGADNVLIEDSTFHDLTVDAGCPEAPHPDGMESCGVNCGNSTVNNITIRRSRFYNLACDDFRMGETGDTNHTIENNFLGASASFAGGCGQEIQVDVPGAIIRYNTIDGTIQESSDARDANRQVYGNIFTSAMTCPAGTGTVAEYNVWLTGGATTCGGAANTRVASMSGWFTNTATADFHLTGSATSALGAGNPSAFPSTDYDGQARANPPDAGADEVP